MSLIVRIAEAVTAELNSAVEGTFCRAFTAARHYRPQFELAELKSLRVSVVPRGISIASAGRNLNQHDVAVDIAVQRKVEAAEGAEDLEELDGLMLLSEQIADLFRMRRLGAAPEAMWIKTENVPVYSPEHLESKGVFTSVVTLTFRVMG